MLFKPIVSFGIRLLEDFEKAAETRCRPRLRGPFQIGRAADFCILLIWPDFGWRGFKLLAIWGPYYRLRSTSRFMSLTSSDLNLLPSWLVWEQVLESNPFLSGRLPERACSALWRDYWMPHLRMAFWKRRILLLKKGSEPFNALIFCSSKPSLSFVWSIAGSLVSMLAFSEGRRNIIIRREL